MIEEGNSNSVESSESEDSVLGLRATCTEDGWIFEANGKSVGPFSLKEMENLESNQALATQLGVEKKEILKAKPVDYRREISISELNSILASTVKCDEATKALTFLGMLLAQTEADQYNIAFQAESSTGKSYIPLELVEYFPSETKRIYAGASLTSFFHQMGQWIRLNEIAGHDDVRALFDSNELSDENRRVIFIDLESKILIFMDQPHWMLLEKLRPLLSHDRKMLRYDITDKTGRGGLRTETVIIRGYPTVVFATAKPTQEDQKRTRMWLLSPEAGQEKITRSLRLLGARISNRDAFKEWLQNHPTRNWLINRVLQIRASGIKNVIVPQWDKILERFMKERPYLTPRTQRDFPRLLCLIKGIALLNCFGRPQPTRESIIANDSDTEAGFTLYEALASSNELGLSPETYRIYEEVIALLCKAAGGVSRKDLIKQYWQAYHRPLADDRLRRQILPALESAGLITQEANPNDRRETLVYCTVPSPTSQAIDGKETSSKTPEPQKYRGENSAAPRPVNRVSFDMKNSLSGAPTITFPSIPRGCKDICGFCWNAKNYAVLEANGRIERLGRVSEGKCHDCQRPAEIRVSILQLGRVGLQ